MAKSSDIAKNVLSGIAVVGLVVGATLGVQSLVKKAEDEKDKTQEPAAAVCTVEGEIASYPAELML